MVTFVLRLKTHNYNFKGKTPQKTILVAPLHWGLGHATRCIPIIRALLKSKFDVLLGSDGAALSLLRKEFPDLESVELPSYDITYSKKGAFFKLKIVGKLPHITRTIKAEKKLVAALVEEGRIHGIISDNRMGVRNKKVPSVFVTHQLNVLSGKTTWFSSKTHQRYIKKFDECWVPDVYGIDNLSGKLSRINSPAFPVKYIGPLSRMIPEKRRKQYDIMCLLSGPEPQRTMLEEILLEAFSGTEKKILLVQGIVQDKEVKKKIGNIKMVNFLTSEDLEKAINASRLIISRSGYTTIMDLAVMGKQAFFIPTPGQYEQEYLAKRLNVARIVPSCHQDKFALEKLKKVSRFKGLKGFKSNVELYKLFSLFQGE